MEAYKWFLWPTPQNDTGYSFTTSGKGLSLLRTFKQKSVGFLFLVMCFMFWKLGETNDLKEISCVGTHIK